jgi:Ca-activated chloride channel family protein
VQERGNVLIAVDVSGSMLERVPRLGVTRLQLARRAVGDALAAYAGGTAVGLWAFSRRLDGDQDYREVVPLAAPGNHESARARSAALRRGVQSLRARGDTGLFDTTLAAFREVRHHQRSGANLVVVLSDGRNDDPGSISLEQLVVRIRAEQSPARPVQIVTIAYGQGADAGELRAISAASGARSYSAKSPSDLRTVLLTALAGS